MVARLTAAAKAKTGERPPTKGAYTYDVNTEGRGSKNPQFQTKWVGGSQKIPKIADIMCVSPLSA